MTDFDESMTLYAPGPAVAFAKREGHRLVLFFCVLKGIFTSMTWDILVYLTPKSESGASMHQCVNQTIGRDATCVETNPILIGHERLYSAHTHTSMQIRNSRSDGSRLGIEHQPIGC